MNLADQLSCKIRLGYVKAITVRQREFDNIPNYERITRPYQIDQPIQQRHI